MTPEQDLKKAARIDALRDAFRIQLPTRVSAIELQLAALIEDPDDASLQALQHLLHSISGSAATFGYPMLGDRAAHAEEILNECSPADFKRRAVIEVLQQDIAVIRDLSGKYPQLPDSDLSLAIDVSLDSQLVYVLEDDPLLGAQIVEQLHHYGFSAESFVDSGSLLARVDEKFPAAVVADVVIGDKGLEGTETAARLATLMDRPLAVIFISVRDDWTARLSGIRAGGMAYLTKPLDFTLLAETLNRCIGDDKGDPYRVIIVEDDREVAEHYQLLLDSAEINATVVTNPSELLSTMRATKPDLLLMDVHMNSCSGIEVVALLRQHREYEHLPMVFLSSERDINTQLAAIQHGGDGFLLKPVDGRTLYNAISIRIKRYRKVARLMSRDSMTGLLNHLNLELELEREVARSQRSAEPLSFAMLDLDHFKDVNDRFGHSSGDYVINSLANMLLRRLRKVDMAGRYGGEEFGIILPNTSGRQAKVLIDKFREDFNRIVHLRLGESFSVSFSAGISEYAEGSTPRSLIDQADEALYSAKASGRNCVVLATVAVTL